MYQSAPTNFRWYEHIVSPKLTAWFDNLCDIFKPDYLLMVGGIQKPAALVRRARRRGVKTAFLFYINDFFCTRVYAGLADGPCTACAAVPEIPAFKNRCYNPDRFGQFIKSAIVRTLLRREIRKANRVLGYSRGHTAIHALTGVATSALAQVTFQFDPSDLEEWMPTDDGYFAITGQAIMQKGFHLLAGILSRLPPTVRIKMSIYRTEEAREIIDRFGLQPFCDSGRLEIVYGLQSRSDYVAFLSRARGLILTSFYPTTGEFVLQEALYLGKPVIAFDVGAHADILRDGQNAMVASAGKLDEFAQKIVRLDTDPELRRAIGAQARRTALSFYDRAAVAKWDTALT
jgi:glycosyltransferase involved in cell wall biosynthesis